MSAITTKDFGYKWITHRCGCRCHYPITQDKATIPASYEDCNYCSRKSADQLKAAADLRRIRNARGQH